MTQTTNDPRPAPGRAFYSYIDLSGGLNTKRDVHAIERNELAVSQNAWYGTENAVSKRPGTAAFITVNVYGTTFNPSDKAAAVTLSGGNLVGTLTGTGWGGVRATVGLSSGKSYWEMTVTVASGSHVVLGIGTSAAGLSPLEVGADAFGYGYYMLNGQSIHNNVFTLFGATYAINDVIGFALDMGAGTLTVYKNNVSQGVLATGLTGTWFPMASLDDASSSVTANFGLVAFTYTPPTGFSGIVTGTSSGTGTGLAGSGIVAARFNNVSYVVSQQSTLLTFATATSTVYTSITGTTQVISGASRIHAAQMYDPTTPTSVSSNGSLIICTGVTPPLVWNGPGTSLVPVNTSSASGFLPLNFAGTSTITPRFVLCDGQNSNLVYAGEPTFPSAVYISDPFFPEKFSFSATATSSYPGTYSPYLIGQNDGVGGGDITGLAKLGTTIVITKQAAIYFMQLQSVYGNLVFTDYCVSASTGNVAPESLVAFDQFVCFLGNDGAYTCDIYGNIQQITRNVPTFFDNTLTGFAATCANPTNAVGVRQGSRYLLFYDAQNAGHPTNGLWFDFAKPDKDGLPTVGEIIGYAPAGAVQLKGPLDDGNFVWTDATQDRLGKFGIGFSDFGQPIAVKLALKADTLNELVGEKGPVAIKALVNMWIDVAVPQTNSGAIISFIGSITADYNQAVNSPAEPITVMGTNAYYWGNAYWGNAYWSAQNTGTNTTYTTARVTGLQAGQGRALQMGVTEQSTQPWTIIGITGEFNDRDVIG